MRTSYIHRLLLILFIAISQPIYAADVFNNIRFGKNSSILVTDDKSTPVYAWQANKLLIPASTQKIITSLMALDKWGEKHRFNTDFYFADDWLWVKGHGDPYLVSEELDIIAEELTQQLLTLNLNIKGIGIDGTLFSNKTVPGRSGVEDPYNAPIAAVSANFNTIFIKKNGAQIESAEEQTPLTPTAKKLALKLSDGTHRVNLGKSSTAETYFGELLHAKLSKQGLYIEPNIRLSQKPDHATIIYRHKNSHTLPEVLEASLRFSSNFISNQIFVLLAANSKQGSLYHSQDWAKQFLLDRYFKKNNDWEKVVITEGAGLSRDNRISANHLLQVLEDFKPYKNLLRDYENGQAFAKTGTLNGIRTFAGYIDIEKNNAIKQYYFVFLLNDPAPFKYRNTLLKQLIKDLKRL